MERRFAALLEDEVQARPVDLQAKTPVAVVELQTVEGAAGHDGLARRRFAFPIGKCEHGGFAGGGEVFLFERLHRHHDDVEFLVVAVVVFAVVLVVMVMIAAMADDEIVRAGGQIVGACPFERIFGFEELRIEFGGAAQGETAHAHHAVDRDRRVLGAVDFRHRVHVPDARFERRQLGVCREVGFVEEDHIGECDLFLGFVAVADVQQDVLRIDERDDGIEPEIGAHLVVGEKRLCDRRGIGEAGRFDEDGVQAVFAFEQAPEHADQVSAYAAADAAVVHLEEFFVALDDELVIHADIAIFVFDHSDFLPVLLGEDAVEESGFAGSEKAGEDGDGDEIGHGSDFRKNGAASFVDARKWC